MKPLDIAQACVKKANVPMGNGKIDLKFWLIILLGAATAISLLRSIPTMQAMLLQHDRAIVEIKTELKNMPDIIAAKVVSKLNRGSYRRNRDD